MTDTRGLREEIARLWEAAELYESQGLYDHALEAFQNILIKEPDNRKAQAKLVQVRFAQRMQDSGTLHPVAIDAEHMSPRVSVDLGLAYMGMNLYDEALEEFTKAFESSPELRTELVGHVAKCLIRLKEHPDVQEVLTYVMEDKSLTSEEKSRIVEEMVNLYVEDGSLVEAYALLKKLAPQQRQQVFVYDKLLSDLTAAGLTLSAEEAISEDGGPDAAEVPSPDDSEPHRAPMTRSGAVAPSGTDLDLSIPFRTEIRYSRDNQNWRSGRSENLSPDWAWIRVSEQLHVGDALVLQVLLPADQEYDSVWIISRVARVKRRKDSDTAVSVKVAFESYLPGGEARLKSFIDDVVRDPSILAREYVFVSPAQDTRTSGVVFDEAEEQAIRELEAELASENLLADSEVIITRGPEEVREATGAAKEAAMTRHLDAAFDAAEPESAIRFACICGESHHASREATGRTGRCKNCGRLLKVPKVDTQHADAVSDQAIGKIVGGCRILYKLGGGGMGGVFKAHHLALDIPVAVKILHAHLAEKDPVFIKRFLREARSTAKLQHPHIVGVMNVGFEDGLHFLVMPFVGGGNAGAMLAELGRLPVELVLTTAIQVASALTLAEEHNILHRDIKPANILFTDKGEAKLADLGLAKNYDSPEAGITQTGIACGTPLYFSPEQAKGLRDLDIRSDIYSLGITLYHLLDGYPPFMGESAYVIFQKHVHEPLPPFRETEPPLPDAVFRLISKMTEKDPEDRFSNSEELLEALHAVKEELFSTPESRPRKGILEKLGIKRS